MSNLLTDRDFWVKYWESKTDLSVVIPENYLFHRQLADIVNKENVKNAIELGGFPGYYAVFLKKYLKLDVTLLDYFVHQPITEQLLKANGCKVIGSDVDPDKMKLALELGADETCHASELIKKANEFSIIIKTMQ